MSAPSIPNLLSLKGRTTFKGGRGGPSRLPPRRPGASSSSQDAIQGTDTDAAVSRLSAVEAGYLNDPFARHFVSSGDGPPARRFPIINRGTFARTMGIDALVHSFLSGGGRQIVSLGAGTDTRPFRLFQDARQLTYHEIDFPSSSARKLRTMEAVPQLDAILTCRTMRESGWSSRPAGGEYHCHGMDLRGLSKDTTLHGLSDVPTLVLSECCLCYLAPSEADAVIEYFSSRLREVVIVIYEPMHLGDPFSDTMMANLAARGITMPALHRCRNQEDQEARLLKAGLEQVRHMTIDRIWDAWVQQGERERLDALEGLDEVEEWKLLAGHYVVVWGCRGIQLQGLPG